MKIHTHRFFNYSVLLLVIIWACSSSRSGSSDMDAQGDARDQNDTAPEATTVPMCMEGCDLPEVLFETPLNGSFTTNSSTFSKGTLVGDNIVHVFIGSNEVQTSQNRFESLAAIDDSKRLTAITVAIHQEDGRVTRGRVSVVFGESFPIDGTVNPAGIARINPSGMETISRVVEKLIQEYDLKSVLDQANPIYSEETSELNISGITFEDPNLMLTPSQAGLTIALEVSNFTVSLLGSVMLGGDTIDIDGTLSAKTATLSGLLSFSKGNERVEVVLSNVILELTDIAVNIKDATPETNDLVKTLLETFFLEELGRIIESQIGALLTDNLQKLGVDEPIPNTGIQARFEVSDVVTDDYGIQMTFSGSFRCTESKEGAPVLNGVLRTSGDPPLFGLTIPGTDTPFGVGVAANDDYINQFIVAATACRLIHVELKDKVVFGPLTLDLTTDGLHGLLPALSRIFPVRPVILEIDASVFPIVTIMTGDRLLKGEVTNLWVNFNAPTTDGQGMIRLMRFGLDGAFSANVELSADRTLKMKDLQLDMALVFLENRLGEHEGPLTDLVSFLKAQLTPLLAGTIEIVQIPEIPYVDLTVLKIGADGTSENYLTIYADVTSKK